MQKYSQILVATVFCATAFLGACGGCGGNNALPDAGGDDAGADAAGGDASTAPQGFVCDGLTVEGTVAASPWMTPLTGVENYRYSWNTGDIDLDVDLLDGEDATLARMLVTQMFDEDAEYPPGTMHATLTRDDDITAEMYNRAEFATTEYRVHTTLLRGTDSVDIVATFARTSCAASDESVAPGCASPVPIADPAFVVASCGLFRDTWEAFGDSARLESLTYEMAEASSTVGGRREGEAPAATLRVFDRGMLTPAADVEKWLADTGADAIIGSDDERLLTSAMLDTVWRRQFREHADTCAAGEALNPAALGCSTSSNPNALEIRQAATGCETATRRDEDSYGEAAPTGYARYKKCASGCSHGDPHMVSFDGHAFDFQGAGEYIAAMARSGDPFEVQLRMAPIGSSLPFCGSISSNRAMAFRFGQHRIAIYARASEPIWVDGVPTPRNSLDLPNAPPGSGFEVSATTFEFWWPTGERVEGNLTGYMDVEIDLPDSRSGEVYGLFGTFSGSQADDFMTRDGQLVTNPTKDELYNVFGQSWRITPFESLFDYDAGEDSSTFELLDFPESIATVAGIPAAELAEARATCDERGIADPWLYDACLLDVACANSGNGAASARDLSGPLSVTDVDDVSVTVEGAMRTGRRFDALDIGDTEPGGFCREDVANVIWLIPEQRAVTLAAAVTIDAAESGEYALDADLSSRPIAAGTEVWSYVVHFDRNGRHERVPAEGRATFSSTILGVIARATSLESSDASLSADGVSYTAAADRTPELGEDRFEISEDGHTLTVHFEGDTNIDQLRVIVDGGAQ